MSAPLVTVVIPNYNYARFLGQAIDSVLAQTFRDFEVLVIDNGSTDNSIDVLRGYGNRVRWIGQENRGQAGSRNRGIEESRGKFIAFLDADDVWSENKLEKQMPLFKNPKVGLVYCGIAVTDVDLKVREVVLPQSRGRVLCDFTDGGRAVVVGGESSCIIRRECLDRAGGFDPNLSLSSGWDMYRRIASSYEFDYVSEPLIFYRQHGNNTTQSLVSWAHDVPIILEKMFSDPLCSKIHHKRRRTWSKFLLMLAASFYKAGQWMQAFKYAANAVYFWPPELIIFFVKRRERKVIETMQCLPMKTRFLNAFRDVCRWGPLERMLVTLTEGRKPSHPFSKLLPNHYQYPPQSFRTRSRLGVLYELDISDLVEWAVYFGLSEPARDTLLSLPRPGDTVLDIGTNIGDVFLTCARLVGPNGRVIGFEPDPTNYRKCLRNLALNDLPNASVRNIGLGPAPADLRMVVNTVRNRGGNRISDDPLKEGFTVKIIPLDEFVAQAALDRVDLIKIDVEGYELKVLQGGWRTVERFRPRLFIEVDDDNLRAQGASAAELVRELEARGYGVTSAEDGRMVTSGDDFRGFHFDIVCVAKA